MKKNILAGLVGLLVALQFSLPSQAAAAIVVTERELATLQSQFEVLKSNNGKLKCILIRQDERLKNAEKSLTITSEELTNANLYYEAYKKEQRRKLREAKFRTNISIICGVLLTYCVASAK